MRIILLFILFVSNLAFAYSPNNFDKLLQSYVSEDGWVDYTAWSENQNDLSSLQSFVDEMAVFNPEGLDKYEALAFWINAYNALAIHEVLERYPVDTIRPAFLGIPERSFFVEQEHIVNGQNYSLDQIENEIIRPMGEPRIHFAINCASVSCPELRNEAYKAETLDAQLTEQAILFINDSSRNQFNLASGSAQISKIFDWFKGDFADAGGVRIYLQQFAKGDALELLQNENSDIGFLTYNWGLNSLMAQ